MAIKAGSEVECCPYKVGDRVRHSRYGTFTVSYVSKIGQSFHVKPDHNPEDERVDVYPEDVKPLGGGKPRKVDGRPAPGGAAERWKTQNNFIDFTMGDLTPAEVKVWFILFRDSKGGTAATAQRDIARRAKVGLKFVSRAIGHLEELGLLKVIHRGGYRRGMSRYRVFGLVASPQHTP